jgi:hypothetical protein
MVVSDLHCRAGMKHRLACSASSLFFTVALSAALTAALAACGDSGTTTADAAPGTPDAAPGTPDAHVPPADCRSPFALPVDPQAKSKAQAELAALSPAATFEWSETRQTLSFATGLGVELPGCTGDADSYAKLFDFLEAHGDLFQIDRADWRVGPALECSEVIAGSFNNTLVIRRIKYGPLALVNDVFHADLDLVEGRVVIKNLGGTYIPRADAATLDKLQSCAEKSNAELEPVLRAAPFAYANFDPPPAPICSLGAPGSYTAVAADTLTISPDFEVLWDDADVVTIYKVKRATLLVAPAGITPELERSDANCPDDDFNPRVGWIRFFDPVSGKILGDKVNPIEGCVVC